MHPLSLSLKRQMDIALSLSLRLFFLVLTYPFPQLAEKEFCMALTRELHQRIAADAGPPVEKEKKDRTPAKGKERVAAATPVLAPSVFPISLICLCLISLGVDSRSLSFSLSLSCVCLSLYFVVSLYLPASLSRYLSYCSL